MLDRASTAVAYKINMGAAAHLKVCNCPAEEITCSIVEIIFPEYSNTLMPPVFTNLDLGDIIIF